ncbi:MAG TPA: M3 family oligoendopeptidase [Candidatus Saccharimonadales bacterium]|nr:M3 family oligoendopeptidase [Candidatus Saccharimonadales bacterium]
MSLDTAKTKWELSPLLKSDDDPNIQKYREVTTKLAEDFAGKWRERKDYLEQPGVLKAALDELEALERRPEPVAELYYFSLRTSQDAISSDLKAKENQSDEFSREINTKLQFFWLNIAKIPADKQADFLNSPDLEPYHHALERTFASAKYRLTEPEEKILTLLDSTSFSKWVAMTSNFLAKEEREVITEAGKKEVQNFEQLHSLISSTQKPVRDEAAVALNDVLYKFAEVAENEFNAILETKKIKDQLRGYERPDKARHVGDDVDSEVIDALVAAITDGNEIPRRYYELKAKLMGQEKLEYHERNVEYGSVEKEYDFESASQLVHGVFTDLDPEFGGIFARFLKNGQIDAFPYKGKRGGAFCAGQWSLAIPTYILLNHTNKLRDVATLAHELGHGINNELMKAKQNAINCGIPMVTAEVASTFMEDFVLERLLGEASDEERLALQMSQLNDMVSTIYRQISFYRFEQRLHADFRDKGYLSKDDIGHLFKAEMEAYMGPAVEQSEGSGNWWLFVPHFRSFFYVYSYASGLLISKSMQAKVRQDKRFVAKVKEFLSVGTSKSPKAAFADLGIDISDKQFWVQGLKEIERLLNDTEKLAKKLGKIT